MFTINNVVTDAVAHVIVAVIATGAGCIVIVAVESLVSILWKMFH